VKANDTGKGRRRVKSFGLSFIILGLLTGCSAYSFVQGVENDPVEHRLVVSASGYSLDGCQANMDELAGTNVQMTEHTGQMAMSLLNLLTVPGYTCRGFVQEPQTRPQAQMTPTEHTK
jgi:hypothetical protein